MIISPVMTNLQSQKHINNIKIMRQENSGLQQSNTSNQICFGNNFQIHSRAFINFIRKIRVKDRIPKNPLLEKGKEVLYIAPDENGNEFGLNKIIGNSRLKFSLLAEVMIPLYRIMHGEHSFHKSLPKGILFFGPKGSGKTFTANQLGEHYMKKGGYFEKLSLTGSAETDIDYLQSKFDEAEQKFIQSNKKKYTMFFIDEIEKIYPNNNNVQTESFNKLYQLTRNCPNNGVIIITAANYLDKIKPRLLKNRFDMRMPIGYINRCDLGAMIKYYLIKYNIPHNSHINFKRISDAITNQKLKYKPKDLEIKLINLSKPYIESNEKLDANSIIEALTAVTKKGTKEENMQFSEDKKLAMRLGGIHKC